MSIVELTSIMAAVALALGMLVVILAGALKIETASATSLRRLGAQHELANQFRADVARAAAAPEDWQDDVAGPTCLILGMGKDRHVVYRFQADRLRRFEYTGDEVQQREVALGGTGTAAEFVRPPAGSRLQTLRVYGVRKPGNWELLVEITAALGGDRQ
jgi:hypothetical protein